MNIRIKGNKGFFASIIAIVLSYAMVYVVFDMILGWDSDVLKIILFIIMFVPLRGAIGTRLGEDRSQMEKDYEEMDSRLRIKKDKKK